MTGLLTLLAKEWRLRGRPVAISLLIILAVGTVAWFRYSEVTAVMGVLLIPALASLVLHAVLLAGAFTSEWQQNTHYQLLSLPIRPVTIAVAKYLFYLLAGIASMMIMCAWLAVSDYAHTQVITDMPGNTLAILLRLSVAYYLSVLLFLLGASLLIQGYTVGRTRYRGLAARILFLSLLALTALLAVPITALMSGLGYYEMDILGPSASLTEISYYPALFIYLCVTGILFTMAGLYLFQRRADL